MCCECPYIRANYNAYCFRFARELTKKEWEKASIPKWCKLEEDK